MINDELNWLEWAFKGIVGGAFIVGAWLWNNLVSTMQQIKKDVAEVDKSLDDHKLYSVDTFIKKDVVERIHSRMDNMGKDIGDIKTLLVQTLTNSHKN